MSPHFTTGVTTPPLYPPPVFPTSPSEQAQAHFKWAFCSRCSLPHLKITQHSFILYIRHLSPSCICSFSTLGTIPSLFLVGFLFQAWFPAPHSIPNSPNTSSRRAGIQEHVMADSNCLHIFWRSLLTAPALLQAGCRWSQISVATLGFSLRCLCS